MYIPGVGVCARFVMEKSTRTWHNSTPYSLVCAGIVWCTVDSCYMTKVNSR